MKFYRIDFNSSAFIIIGIVIFLLDTLPASVLFIQYRIKNDKAVLTINTQTKELLYQTPSTQIKHPFSNIIALQYYHNLGKGTGWYSFGEYRYYKIIFNDKKEIIITCLMINDIENTLEILLKVKAEQHAKWLCLIDRA
jgi:hypothetical protein